MKTKNIKLKNFLTKDQIRTAKKLRTARQIADHVIRPNLPEIHGKIGEEIDALFLGFLVEFVLFVTQSKGISRN